MEDIRFDNIAGLTAKITDQFGAWSQTVEITQDMINKFADVTGDHQWIHIDVERARRESPFRAPVAHGFLTLSLLAALHSEQSFRVVGSNLTVNYGANKLRFVAPVPAGSKVHARSRMIAVEKRPQGTQVTMETHLNVVGSDKPALIYEGLFLYVG